MYSELASSSSKYLMDSCSMSSSSSNSAGIAASSREACRPLKVRSSVPPVPCPLCFPRIDLKMRFIFMVETAIQTQ